MPIKESFVSENLNQRQEGGDHYLNLRIQPWDAMESWLTGEQFSGFLLGSAIKYLARYNADAPGKGGLADLKKAQHYLDRLIAYEKLLTLITEQSADETLD